MARFHVSDDEFIAKVRRHERANSIVRTWAAVVQLAGGFGLCYMFWRFLPPFIGKLDQQTAILTGLIFGTLLGVTMVSNVATIVYFLAGQRMTRMLLRYHDELAALKGEPGPQGSGCIHPRGD